CCAGCSNAQGKALDAVKQPYVKRSVCRVGNSSTGQCFTNNSRGITTTYVIGLADLAAGAAIVKPVRHGGVPGYVRCCSSKAGVAGKLRAAKCKATICSREKVHTATGPAGYKNFRIVTCTGNVHIIAKAEANAGTGFCPDISRYGLRR